MAKKIRRWDAPEIIGSRIGPCGDGGRRWSSRVSGLMDCRKGKPSNNRVPLAGWGSAAIALAGSPPTLGKSQSRDSYVSTAPTTKQTSASAETGSNGTYLLW